MPFEQRRRIQAGGCPDVQRLVVGGPVQVDDETRILRRHHAGAQFTGKIVELRNVPVGVRQAARLVDQALAHRRGQVQAGVGHADQQRHAALFEVQNLIHYVLLQLSISTP